MYQISCTIVFVKVFKIYIFALSLEQQQLVPQPVLTKFVGEDDILILEDELQRIQLTGHVDVNALVTGQEPYDSDILQNYLIKELTLIDIDNLFSKLL